MKTLLKILWSPFRLLHSCLITFLLLLIVALLLLDPAERRPFVRDSAQTLIHFGDKLLKYGRQQLEQAAIEPFIQPNPVPFVDSTVDQKPETQSDHGIVEVPIVVLPPEMNTVVPEREAPSSLVELLGDMQQPSSYRGLPNDFVRKLEQAITRTPTRKLVTQWNDLWQNTGDKLPEKAIQLAIQLPDTAWPVDGKLVPQIHLRLFLE